VHSRATYLSSCVCENVAFSFPLVFFAPFSGTYGGPVTYTEDFQTARSLDRPFPPFANLPVETHNVRYRWLLLQSPFAPFFSPPLCESPAALLSMCTIFPNRPAGLGPAPVTSHCHLLDSSFPLPSHQSPVFICVFTTSGTIKSSRSRLPPGKLLFFPQALVPFSAIYDTPALKPFPLIEATPFEISPPGRPPPPSAVFPCSFLQHTYQTFRDIICAPRTSLSLEELVLPIFYGHSC